MSPRRNAFTLIELLIVLLVLGVLAGVAAPRYAEAVRARRLEAASLRVAADLRMAQREAVRVSSNQVVAFAPADNRYEVPTMRDPDNAGRPTYAVRFDQTGYAVELLSADFDGDAAVTFDVFGQPSAGGLVVLRHGRETRSVALSEAGEVTLPEP